MVVQNLPQRMIAKITNCFDLEAFFLWLISFSHGVSSHELEPVSGVPTQAKPIYSISDLDFFRSYLPHDLIKSLITSDYSAMNLLSFSVRYLITHINLSLHVQSLKQYNDKNKTQISLVNLLDHETNARVCQICTDLEYNFTNIRMGFSATGFHFNTKNKNHCRAFDQDSIPLCREDAAPLVCHKHEKEKWWDTDASDASVQAKMHAFYCDSSNLEIWNEVELQTMFGKFWQHIRTHKAASEEDISHAMKFFNYEDKNQLIDAGMAGLRKKYLAHSLKNHPDKGGHSDEFVQVNSFYQVLRKQLK